MNPTPAPPVPPRSNNPYGQVTNLVTTESIHLALYQTEKNILETVSKNLQKISELTANRENAQNSLVEISEVIGSSTGIIRYFPGYGQLKKLKVKFQEAVDTFHHSWIDWNEVRKINTINLGIVQKFRIAVGQLAKIPPGLSLDLFDNILVQEHIKDRERHWNAMHQYFLQVKHNEKYPESACPISVEEHFKDIRDKEIVYKGMSRLDLDSLQYMVPLLSRLEPEDRIILTSVLNMEICYWDTMHVKKYKNVFEGDYSKLIEKIQALTTEYALEDREPLNSWTY